MRICLSCAALLRCSDLYRKGKVLKILENNAHVSLYAALTHLYALIIVGTSQIQAHSFIYYLKWDKRCITKMLQSFEANVISVI